MKSEMIYLDYPSSTPVDPRVLHVMMEALRNDYGNPSNLTHHLGRRARDIVEQARAQVAACIGAKPDEIFFTKGATESNNLAIYGLSKGIPDKRHIVTTAIEHKAVLEPCKHLEKNGYDLTLLALDKNAQISYAELEQSIRPDTLLVSLMWVNNEIGSTHDVEKIAEIAGRKKVVFHTDGTQAVGKLNVDVSKLNIPMMSLSAHKIYGPKGIGALYVRRDVQPLLKPMMLGGGQERGLVSGTSNVPAIVGFGKACEIISCDLARDMEHAKSLSEQVKTFFKSVSGVHYVTPEQHSVPAIINIAFEKVSGTELICQLENVALSSASACCSGNKTPSHVLTGIGFRDDLSQNNIRLGVGRFTTNEQLKTALSTIASGIECLRSGRDIPHSENGRELTADQVYNCLDDFCIVDVRTSEEFFGELGHIHNSLLKTLDGDLDVFLNDTCVTKAHLFVCRTGRRSLTAVDLAKSKGIEKAFSLTGGMVLWNQKSLPVSRKQP